MTLAIGFLRRINVRQQIEDKMIEAFRKRQFGISPLVKGEGFHRNYLPK